MKRSGIKLICEEPRMKKIKVNTCEPSIHDDVVNLVESDTESDSTMLASSYDQDSYDEFSQFF